MHDIVGIPRGEAGAVLAGNDVVRGRDERTHVLRGVPLPAERRDQRRQLGIHECPEPPVSLREAQQTVDRWIGQYKEGYFPPLSDLLGEPCEVGERGEVSFFILADPPIDRLLGFAQGHGRLRAIVNAELPPLVAPFRGERYAAKDVSALIAPPYDVISSEDRARFAARDPHNIVHLILPEAPSGLGGDRYAQAATLLEMWRQAGVVRPDPADSVYVVAQDYAVPSG